MAVWQKIIDQNLKNNIDIIAEIKKTDPKLTSLNEYVTVTGLGHKLNIFQYAVHKNADLIVKQLLEATDLPLKPLATENAEDFDAFALAVKQGNSTITDQFLLHHSQFLDFENYQILSEKRELARRYFADHKPPEYGEDQLMDKYKYQVLRITDRLRAVMLNTHDPVALRAIIQHGMAEDVDRALDQNELQAGSGELARICDPDRNTYLHLIAKRKFDDNYLLKKMHRRNGVDINQVNAEGKTALIIAIENNHTQMVDYLATLSRLNDQPGIHPMHLVVSLEFDNPSMIRSLERNGIYIDELNPDGNTALHLAIKHNKLSSILELIRLGADLSIENYKKETPDILLQQLLDAMNAAEDNAELLKFKRELNSLLKLRKQEGMSDDDHLKQRTRYKNLVIKGGSVKGIAYVGALRELERQECLKLEEIERVAGTSAGAITALLIGLNYSADEINTELDKLDIMSFLDAGTLSAQVKEMIAKKNISLWDMISYALGTASWLGTIPSIIAKIRDEHGLCDGEVFRQWIIEKIRLKLVGCSSTLDPETITFQELRDLGLFKDLSFVGVNISTGYAEVFSADTTPNMCVADAVRICMSIPGLFKPHYKYVKNEKGERVIHMEKDATGELIAHSYVDGGVADNYPIKLFDLRDLQLNLEANQETLGLCLVSPESQQVFEDCVKKLGDKVQGSGLGGFVSKLYTAISNVQDGQQLLGTDQYRTVFINTLDVGMLSFDITSGKKQELILSGHEGVRNFLNRSQACHEQHLSANTLATLIQHGDYQVNIIQGQAKYSITRWQAQDADTAAKVVYQLYKDATSEELLALRSLVNPNITDSQGNTALHYAKIFADETTIEILTKYANASTSIKNKAGKLAHELEHDPKAYPIKTLPEFEEHLSVLCGQNIRLSEIVAELTKLHEADKATIGTHAVRIEELEAEKQKLAEAYEAQVQSVEQELLRLRSENQSMQDQLALKKMEIKSGEDNNLRIQEQFKQENARIDAKRLELKKTVSSQADELELLRAQVQRLEQEKVSLEQHLEEATETNKVLREMCNDLSQRRRDPVDRLQMNRKISRVEDPEHGVFKTLALLEQHATVLEGKGNEFFHGRRNLEKAAGIRRFVVKARTDFTKSLNELLMEELGNEGCQLFKGMFSKTQAMCTAATAYEDALDPDTNLELL